MTAPPLPPLIPGAASPVGLSSAPPSRARRPLPLPRLGADVARHSDLVYAMSTVDKVGRIADRSVIRVLGWPAGTRLSVREQAGTLLVVPAAGGTCRIDRRGHLFCHSPRAAGVGCGTYWRHNRCGGVRADGSSGRHRSEQVAGVDACLSEASEGRP
jgi:hypothetical protein